MSDTLDSDQVLCGSRVSQMTQTYHDIEAVTRTLQESRKDLELAARIGQQLLARNKTLEEKNGVLETEVSSYSDKITQLKHDLQMKTDLLHIYTNEPDENSTESTPTGYRYITVDLLQNKVHKLETENVSLREEATQLASDTYECEEKEQDLVTDVIKQLNEANLQVHQLSEDLSKKIEDSLRQQDEATQLLVQIVDFQAANKRLTKENEELFSLVTIGRECQEELTTELADHKEKYAEVLGLLHDTQEQLRKAQKRNLCGGRGTHLGGTSSLTNRHDSIATELFSMTENQNKPDGTKNLSRVFDTVRLSSKLGSMNTGSLYTTTLSKQTPQRNPPELQVGESFTPYLRGMTTSSPYTSSSSGLLSLDSGADSDGSFQTDSEDNYPASRTGVPGWPGTPDLNSCLRRLKTSSCLPYGCRTPDSIMSTGSSSKSLSSTSTGYSSSGDWRLPQKLQIVKPIEGSLTLHQWSRLATPNLEGLLEEKEGVAMKGATNTNLDLETYSLSDYEEDEPEMIHPGKQFMFTSGVYTYTNSTVLHPDDITILTPSLRPTQTTVIVTSSSAPNSSASASTPSHSRRGSTATFSTNVGFAKHLQERGIPIAANSIDSMAPTDTPANSPEGSRPESPEPYSYKLPGLEDLSKSIHAGASYLKRTIYGKYPSSPPSPVPKVKIVERMQAMGGVDRFVSSSVSISSLSRTVGGVVTSRPQTPSPLLHLSNLIRAQASTSAVSTTSTTIAVVSGGGIMSAPKITSPGERRPLPPMGSPMGIPGHPGLGHLDNRLKQLKPGQRSDLGSVAGHHRPRPKTLGSKDKKNGHIKLDVFWA